MAVALAWLFLRHNNHSHGFAPEPRLAQHWKDKPLDRRRNLLKPEGARAALTVQKHCPWLACDQFQRLVDLNALPAWGAEVGARGDEDLISILRVLDPLLDCATRNGDRRDTSTRTAVLTSLDVDMNGSRRAKATRQ